MQQMIYFVTFFHSSDMLEISSQSAYLIGRDRIVADIPVDHPSISKQHAVIQYRFASLTSEYGDKSNTIKYILFQIS